MKVPIQSFFHWGFSFFSKLKTIFAFLDPDPSYLSESRCNFGTNSTKVWQHFLPTEVKQKLNNIKIEKQIDMKQFIIEKDCLMGWI